MLDIEPFIQTIHATDTVKPVGGEISCRVRTSSGLVLTNDHIGKIEDSYRADLYTDILLKEISAFYSDRDVSHLDNFVFSLNICMFQITSPILRKSIYNFIESFPIKIGVQLEIVERGIPQINEEMIEAIGHYHSKGINIVMDGFIFDKKSIKYFEVSQLSSIKLDREITMNHHHKLVHSTLIEALVDFAKRFDITVMAEGVENVEQADLLRKSGVDFLQGNLFSKPMSLINFDYSMISSNYKQRISIT